MEQMNESILGKVWLWVLLFITALPFSLFVAIGFLLLLIAYPLSVPFQLLFYKRINSLEEYFSWDWGKIR